MTVKFQSESCVKLNICSRTHSAAEQKMESRLQIEKYPLISVKRVFNGCLTGARVLNSGLVSKHPDFVASLQQHLYLRDSVLQYQNQP